jgi:Ca2+-binding RTX toxin-like protein
MDVAILRGGPGADFLTGNLGNDSLEGGPGDDTLVGIDGDYTSVPAADGDGADTLEGWGGADTIVLGNGDHAWGEFATTTADGAADTFISGTWITGAAPTVHDYDPTVDQLVL